jgi:uncharacterized protein
MILAISPSLYATLTKLISDDSKVFNEDERLMIQKMKEKNLLSDRRFLEIIHPADELLPYYLRNKLSYIILQVTQQCNLRCDYCIYSGNYQNRSHSNAVMNIHVAKQSIDFLVAHSQDSNLLNIGFYGGEPLLQFDLIQQCIEYAIKRTEGKKLLFHITTNGTLLDEKIAKYLSEYDINILISLDGPKEIHDMNRRFTVSGLGTFDLIMKNIETIKDKFPSLFKKLRFNTVINPEMDFKCVNDFFLDQDLFRGCTITASAKSRIYNKKGFHYASDFIARNEYELFKQYLFALGKIDQNNAIQISSLSELKQFHNNLKAMDSLPKKGQHSGPCIPGVNRLFINTRGDFFPCEKVNEDSKVMNIGNIDQGININTARQILNIGKLNSELCKNCWAVRHCTLCAISVDDENKLSASKKAFHCNDARKKLNQLFIEYCTLRELGYDFEYDYDS